MGDMQEVQLALRDAGTKIAFVSHQWLGWDHPDPENVQCKALTAGIRKVAGSFGWDLSSLVVWLDYHSIPQQPGAMQSQAISSLPIFASMSSLFIVLAPPAKHCNIDQLCDAQTYKKRLWCRVELFSHYALSGVNNMYILKEHGLEAIDPSWLFDALFVFEGECTCCFRQHEVGVCDKPAIRDLMLGLYIVLLRRKDMREAAQTQHYLDTYKKIQEHKDRIFPQSYTAEFMRSNRIMREDSGVGAFGSFGSNSSDRKVVSRTVPLFENFLQDLNEYETVDGNQKNELLSCVASVDELNRMGTALDLSHSFNRVADAKEVPMGLAML